MPNVNTALWKFRPEMPEEMFLMVAQQVVRTFVANVVIGAEPSMVTYLATKYLSGQTITFPPLRDIGQYAIVESGDNNLSFGFDKSISVFPHAGRGDRRDDLRLALVIECINERLKEIKASEYITALETSYQERYR